MKALLSDLGNKLATMARSGTASGQCMDDNCPIGRFEFTFMEDEAGDCWPSGRSLLACPTCQNPLRLDQLGSKGSRSMV
jgi:hypothetical protein